MMQEEGNFARAAAGLILLLVAVWATVVGVLHVTSHSEVNKGGPKMGKSKRVGFHCSIFTPSGVSFLCQAPRVPYELHLGMQS